MPSVEHSEFVDAAPSQIWAFVRNMDNWAPFVTGYQRHEKLSESESIWHLKGELGGLTRIAEFKVLIDEWDEGGKVRFSLRGVNEPVTGSGQFLVSTLSDPSAPPQAAPADTGIVARIARWLYSRIFGGKAGGTRHAQLTGPVTSRIDFLLSLNAGGGAGMILNALITPMLRRVAEDLAGKIANAITQQSTATA